jgi:hypothetical protein
MLSLSAVIPMQSVVSVLAMQDGTDQGPFKIPAEAQPDERLTQDNFAKYLYSTFRIETSPFTSINLQLIEVKDGNSASAKLAGKTAERESFSVLFLGPRNVSLESKTYTFTHDQLGTFVLFISPVDARKKKRTYQAVFSRFRS